MICIDIPEGVYTMKAKRSIIKSNALAYRKASKSEKKYIHLKAFIIHNQSWLFCGLPKQTLLNPIFIRSLVRLVIPISYSYPEEINLTWVRFYFDKRRNLNLIDGSVQNYV